ncbi:MAG: hypothetical protein M1821_007816 [Bathelium mastoideum]|nr:MAG: hypothetical protein M1821_007816 [Bathelium mastoideum]
MFNHSRPRQNVGWERDVDHETITYRALQRIEAGEELCISYGDRLTFIDAEEPSEDEAGQGEEEEADFIDNIQLSL